MTYQKPHLQYSELRATLSRRGMDVGDRSTAETTLRTIGYSRLKAYTYPFRVPLPSASEQETPYQMRGKDFFPGTCLEHASALYKFDQNLRRICLDGLQDLEISFRAAIAHTLGKRSQFAHLNAAHLDTGACTALDIEGKAGWDHWLKTYREARTQGKEEDFVAHHLIKYGNDLPIWLTTEILTFGSLVRLFSLLVDSDKTAVARYFGVTDGRRFHKWLLAMNGLRNVCAHHHRLWNRILTYELKVPSATVGPELAHLSALPREKRLYDALALLSYLLKSRDSGSQWPATLRTQLKKFPKASELLTEEGHPVLDMEYSMGCPKGWETLPLWQPN
ncbi:Abi family protein [Micrococcaceae bacterium Sec5.1]|uniref:Abi family protein n=1 Tax=unclassified Paenarthrobacter TaxID=2634190 RepID=UPI003366F266